MRGSYHLNTECLTVNAEVMKLIEFRNIRGIRPLLEKLKRTGDAGCHTMNPDLSALIKAKKVSLDDARKATTDRTGFMEMFNSKAAQLGTHGSKNQASPLRHSMNSMLPAN
jgi:twitching motility protein PilT